MAVADKCAQLAHLEASIEGVMMQVLILAWALAASLAGSAIATSWWRRRVSDEVQRGGIERAVVQRIEMSREVHRATVILLAVSVAAAAGLTALSL